MGEVLSAFVADHVSNSKPATRQQMLWLRDSPRHVGDDLED
jgi:hypothetical protein